MSVRAEYVTRPREEIANVLRRERRFLTAAEIHQKLSRAKARVALSTVYRTLERLRDKGGVTERVAADGDASYMLCEPQVHHHHAICRKCGKVEDVDCTAIDRFTQSLRKMHGFTLDEHAMEFLGRCKECR
ncbi:MAG TPA: transcriptional repressor [Candidatus Tyrphobacter sp.]